jgi:hypothetical protein
LQARVQARHDLRGAEAPLFHGSPMLRSAR